MPMKATMAEIIAATCEVAKISRKDLFTRCNKRHYAWPRHACMVVARRWTDRSLYGIASALSNPADPDVEFDHAVVIYAVRMVDREAKRGELVEGSRAWLVDQIEDYLGLGL